MDKEKKQLGIYEIKSVEKTKLQNSKTQYTILGSHDKLVDGYPVVQTDDQDDRVLAKKESINDKENYYIKVNDAGNLMNPMSPEPMNYGLKAKIIKDNKLNQFIKVTAECFDQYLIFLKTKNILHFKFAERQR